MGAKSKKRQKDKNNTGSSDPVPRVAADVGIEDDVYEEMGGLLDEAPPPKWYDQYKDDPDNRVLNDEDELVSLRFEAQKVLEDETKFYNSKIQKSSGSSDAGVLRTVLERGTAGDKLAALIVSVQNSPVHNLNALTTLVGMVKVARKRQCIEAMKVVSQLFVEDLLRSDFKLRTFDAQPLSQLNSLCNGEAMGRRKRLAAWAFEEKLKQLYHQFVASLDVVAKDTLDTNREKAITTMNYLLESNPELEDVLLKNIINKMGDPSQKVASKVIYCLTQLLRKHPNMKKVVMDEVERLLFRPNISPRTQYYAICFLSQFVFREKDKDVARSLINIYFSFFKASIKKGEVDSRQMGALLMGVKRAYPYAKLTTQSDESSGSNSLKMHMDTLYKLVHVSMFNIALHALALLHQVSSIAEDRFYSALYKKILDAQLGESTHHALLINLLYKTLQGDENVNRVKAMVKRLLQMCLHLPVPLVCGLLFMISQLFKRRRTLVCFETSALPEMPYFLSEVKLEEGVIDLQDDDVEERYFDVDAGQPTNPVEGAEAFGSEDEEKKPLVDIEQNLVPSRGWYHCETMGKQQQPKWANRVGYDPNARNPLYAGADMSAYFELLSLANHFHPTVSLFAYKILNDEIIMYGGDPLSDFTLVRFLERFVFKNPKKATAEHNRVGPDPRLAMRKYYEPSGPKGMPITSKQYLSLAESTVPVDELFLYRYLKEKYGEEGLPKRRRDDDNDSVASEEFEEMIDSMMQKSKKKSKKKEDVEEEDSLDFMEDVGDTLKCSKKGGKQHEDEEVEETDDDEDGSDEEYEDDDAEELSDFEDVEDDNDVMVFSGGEEGGSDVDLDEFYDEEAGKGKKKKKPDEKLKRVKKNKYGKNDLRSLFAPAEEFAEILEETGAATQKQGMAHILINKENAAVKQLNWEASRNRWVKGVGEHRKRKAGGGGPSWGGPKGGNNKKFKGRNPAKKAKKR